MPMKSPIKGECLTMLVREGLHTVRLDCISRTFKEGEKRMGKKTEGE